MMPVHFDIPASTQLHPSLDTGRDMALLVGSHQQSSSIARNMRMVAARHRIPSIRHEQGNYMCLDQHPIFVIREHTFTGSAGGLVEKGPPVSYPRASSIYLATFQSAEHIGEISFCKIAFVNNKVDFTGIPKGEAGIVVRADTQQHHEILRIALQFVGGLDLG